MAGGEGCQWREDGSKRNERFAELTTSVAQCALLTDQDIDHLADRATEGVCRGVSFRKNTGGWWPTDGQLIDAALGIAHEQLAPDEYERYEERLCDMWQCLEESMLPEFGDAPE